MSTLMTRSLLALSLLCTAALPAQAITISVNPAAQTVEVGSSLLVSVDISDLIEGGAPSLGGFDLNLSYDPGILSVSDLSFGTGLDVLGLGSLQFPDTSTAGLINVFELSWDQPEELNQYQLGAFTLFTVTFQTIGAGVSHLGLTTNELSDEWGEALSAALVGGNVTVVPLPAAGWLLLSGVAALAGFGRRRSSLLA